MAGKGHKHYLATLEHTHSFNTPACLDLIGLLTDNCNSVCFKH